MRYALCALAAALCLSGCAEPPPEDLDDDGWPGARDCDDLNANVFPGNGESCDGVDNDCDGTVDEGYDEDADGFNTCGADRDCDDMDNDVYPGAEEVCDGVDNNCDTVVDENCESDGDGDGFPPSVDCDDTDPLVYPDAPELCNGFDDDCDDAIDEGFDEDGDGWSYCDDVDCDDADPAVHPEAPEVCDGDDEDCDGQIDEDFDADGDGWTTCHDPADCDDAVASTHPLAPEQCNGIDDDCDGSIDEDTDDDLDGDGVSACNGDCDDNDPDVFPGAAEIPNGIDDDCSGAADDGYSGIIDVALFSPKVTGSVTQGRVGDVLSTDGFIDGDAYADFVAGSATHDGGRGRSHLVLGQSFSVTAPPAAVSPQATVTGQPGDYLGHSVDLGDINDDGYDDWLIGAPELGSVDPPKGAVYIFFGAATPPSGELPPTSADVTITGGFPTEQCGTAVAALGDVDGDGVGDLGFSCPWFNPGDGNLRGRTVIFLGRSAWSPTYTSDDGDAWIVGSVSDAESGQALAGDFDMNGDGLADVAIGSPNYADGDGRVGLFLGRPTASWVPAMDFAAADRLWAANVDLAQAGGATLGTGDADGDAYGDLLIGVPLFSGGRGAMALMRGAASLPLSGSIYSAQLWVTGAGGTNEALGTSGELLDVDGDGVQDLVCGVPGWDDDSAGDRGRVAVVYGPLTALSGEVPALTAHALIQGEVGGDFFGGAMTTVDDYNAAGGAADLWVSSPFSDAGAPNGGRVYFVPGF